MIIKKLGVGKGVTVSVGKFESVRIDVHVECDMVEKDDIGACSTKMYDVLDNIINDQITGIKDIIQETSVFNVQKNITPPSRRRQ